jgi:2-succinyl-6-hydroxy-2,4-cyclohexadiene-1-carboxylate synthase
VTSLATRVVGSGEPIAFVHGFTQTGNSWLPLLEHMATPMRATLIDAPDHGNSHVSLSLTETADALFRVAEGQTLAGYSMGARMVLTAAVAHPNAFTRLILVSGTAGLDTEEERRQRRDSDEALASHIEDIGIEAFISEWLSNPMFAGLSTENARISERLTNSAAGLASSLRLTGTGTQQPLWDSLHSLTMPVLIIAGENDAKFSAIAQRLHSLIPASDLHIHAHVGHTVHLEDAAGCAAVIDNWLERTQR